MVWLETVWNVNVDKLCGMTLLHGHLAILQKIFRVLENTRHSTFQTSHDIT
jgi:hypothetical protein